MQDEFPEIVYPKVKTRSFFYKKRTWLNILLFCLTTLSAYFVGISWSLSYLYAEAFSRGDQVSIGPGVLKDPQVVSLSMVYAVVLIGILLAHEMGHYLTCRYYHIDATLPFFIPAPTLIGTLGAFIKIKSPITRKQQLFDIGVAGPLAGFILAVPALVYGLSVSKIVPSLPREESLVFGEPLLLKGIGMFLFGHVPAGYDVVIHPVAFAGWVGILVTALNLFPIGQLDGGHVLYALIGPKSRKLANWILTAFIFLGIFCWVGWFIWALLIRFIGLRHPPIMDESIPLTPKRKLMAVLVLFIFIISFIPSPIQDMNLFDLIKQFQGAGATF